MADFRTDEMVNLLQNARLSAATAWGANRNLIQYADDTLRIDHDPVTGKSLGLLLERAATRLNNNPSGLSMIVNDANGSSSALSSILDRAGNAYVEITASETQDNTFSIVGQTSLSDNATARLTISVARGTSDRSMVIFRRGGAGAQTDSGLQIDWSSGSPVSAWGAGVINPVLIPLSDTEVLASWAFTANEGATHALRVYAGGTTAQVGNTSNVAFPGGSTLVSLVNITQGATRSSLILASPGSQAVRANDNAATPMLPIEAYDPTRGTIFIEGTLRDIMATGQPSGPSSRSALLGRTDDPSVAERWGVQLDYSGAGAWAFFQEITSRSSTVPFSQVTPQMGQRYKIAITHSPEGGRVLSVNGVSGSPSTVAVNPLNQQAISIGWNAATSVSGRQNMHVHRLDYTPRVYTAQQLANLTGGAS